MLVYADIIPTLVCLLSLYRVILSETKYLLDSTYILPRISILIQLPPSSGVFPCSKTVIAVVANKVLFAQNRIRFLNFYRVANLRYHSKCFVKSCCHCAKLATCCTLCVLFYFNRHCGGRKQCVACSKPH